MTPRILLVALLAALAAASPASAALKFGDPCGGNFDCAKLRVPLDRTGGVPGTIQLSIERVRARGKRHEGAVFAIAGGPGQGASSLSDNFASDTFGAIGTRDLIVVDQRGTGRSGALDCKALERPDDRPIDVRTAECAEELGARRGFYTTADTVADLEAVRAALGIERITLFGVSYGTKVALTYAATHPEHVEKLVLDSVVTPQGQNPFDLDSLAAMPRVFAEMCRGECEGITDDLAADVAALADRLPLRGPLIDARGRRLMRTVTARDLYQQIRASDTVAEFRVVYPGIIRAALDGDVAPLVRLIRGGELRAGGQPPSPSLAEVLSFTLQATTLCEEAPLPWERFASPEERIAQARAAAAAIPDAAFEPFSREVALALDTNSLLLQCRRWPATPARGTAPGLDELPDVPALVLEGAEDLRTPLEVGARVAAAFPQGQLLEVPKSGHAVLGAQPCARVALKRFMAGEDVGDSCDGARRLRIEPVPPGSLGAVAGGSRSERTLAAVRLTIRDLRAALLSGLDRGGGLRSGFFAKRGRSFDLKRFSYVPGVTLSGPFPLLERDKARLRVGGEAAAAMTVVVRDGKVTRAR